MARAHYWRQLGVAQPGSLCLQSTRPTLKVACAVVSRRQRRMAQGSIRTRYNHAAGRLQTTFGLWVGDVRLKLGATEKSWRNMSSAPEDVEIGFERPGYFMVEHHLHKQHTRFQFHNDAEVFSKNIRLTFVHHHHGHPETSLEAESQLSSNVKAVVKQNFHKKGPLVRCAFFLEGLTVTPQLDFAVTRGQEWGIAVKKSFGGKDYFKASYVQHKREAELELVKSLNDGGGPLKVLAVLDMGRARRSPVFIVEKEWKF